MDVRILFITDDRQIDATNNKLRETGSSGAKAGSQIEAGMGRARSGAEGVFAALKPLSGVLATLGLASVATDAMNAYRSFESMMATLKTMTGSTASAAAAFGQLQAFAAQTPYTLDQSVQGFVKLKALGLDPSISSLRSYGNTASAMGKDLMQMVEAVADASTGEFERLKEFGIKASKQGNEVAFTFQGVTTKVGNNAKEIQDYLLKIGNTTFATAMSDQANTLNGQISALKDNWSALQVKVVEQIGAADLAKASVAALAGVLGNAGQWIDSATASWAIFVESLRSAEGGVYATLRESINGISVGFERLITALTPAYDAISQFLSGSISSSDVLQILSDVLGAAGLALQDMAAAIEWLIAKAAELGIFATVSEWFDSLTSSAGTLSPYITEFIGTFGAFAAVGLTVATGLGVVSTAVKALSAVLMVNPVVAIIAGIATATYLLHEHWDEVAVWWDRLWGDVESSASEFADWWNSTTFEEKRADIQTWTIETAQALAEDFINWWNGSLLKEWAMPVATAALTYAEQKATEFGAWWDSWTLREVTADVTAELLIWAWEKAQAFNAWWASWHLLPKESAVDTSLVEKAWDYVQRFKNWWDNLSLKSIMPTISVAGAVEGAKRFGGDLMDGIADGIGRAKSHINSMRSATEDLEKTARTTADTHSPSKVMAAVGSDVVDGLAVGIEKNSSKAAKAAKAAAEKVSDTFKGIMQGLNKQFIELTQGEETARRYELTQQKIVGANQEAVITLEAQIKAAEEQKKKTEELKQAFESAQKAVEGSATALQLAQQSAGKTDEQIRVLELSLKSGYTPAMAAAQAANEAQVKSLEATRKAAEDAKKAFDDAAKAVTVSEQALSIAQQAMGKTDEQVRALELALKAGYTPAMAAAQAANEAAAKSLEQLRAAQNKANEAVVEAKDKLSIAQAAIGKTDEELRALVLSHEKGYTPALAKAQAATEAQTKALESYRTDMQRLNQEQAILEARLRSGEEAARALELGFKGYNAEQIKSIQGVEAFNQKLAASLALAKGVGDALAHALFTGDWKGAGQSILGQLKSTFVDPLKKSLSDAITQGLSGGNAGGLMGSLGKLLNFDGIKGALGGVGSSIGTLFGSIASSAANGFAGISTAISGGLSGIMGSFGTLVSAIPVWGWALAGAAGLAKLFGGPSAPKIRLTQGATDGQGMLTDGQQHFTKTALGTVGATDDSYKIGRAKGFVPKLHEWFKWVESFDAMVAKTLPNSIGAISEALKGVEMKGANLEAFTRQRLHTIFSALPEALQVAIQGGKNIMAGTTEEIAARFMYMSQVAESGLIPALEQLGLVGTQSKESMIAFAMGLADAMGGIDAAKAALDNYYQTAYTDAERLALTQSTAKAKLDEYNASLGLSGSQYIDTAAKLRARIDAEDASTAAGQKNIASLLKMVDAIKVLSGTAEEAAAKLKSQWDDFNNAAYTDAQRENIAKKQAQKLVDQFNQTYGTSLANIIDARQLMRTIDTTTEAGRKMQQSLLGLTGSLVTLGGTAQQIKEKIAGLKEGIKDLAGNLYGKTTTSTTTTSNNQAALTAAQATLDSLRSRYDIEKQRIDDINQASQDAYRKQIDYYNSLKSEAESLRGIARGFADESRNAADTLKAAQLDYNNTLRAAQSGDVDAAGKMGEVANRLKAALGAGYNNDDRAALGIRQIESQLLATAGMLDKKAGAAPNEPGTITSTLLKTLESQIKAQESAVSALQQLVSTQNNQNNTATDAQNRAALAADLAKKIGDLGLATDKSAWDILKANGVNIKDLAKDFGINVNQLDGTFVKKVAELSGMLNVNSLQLLKRLDVNVKDLAAAYGINTKALDKTMVDKIGALAGTLNVNSLQLINKLGVSVQDIAKAYGINTAKLDATMISKIGALASTLNINSLQLLNKLNVSVAEIAAAYGINTKALDKTMVDKIGALASTLNINSLQLLNKLNVSVQDIAKAYGLNTDKINGSFVTKLDKLADTLKLSSVDLAAKLGVNIKDLSAAMALKLASLPGVPDNIKKGLEPYLNAIRSAADPTTLKNELLKLQSYVNTLPPGIKGQLNEQLAGILGFTSKTDKNTGDTKTETLALRSIKSAVDNTANYTGDLTAYTRDQVNARGIQLALQNSRALNQHAAKIGKEAIPSFAIGSDKLPADMLANVHKGEMIFTAAQSNSMRDLALYNQAIIPQIGSYLSQIAATVAANDNQAPVFIQPVVSHLYQNDKNGNAELINEIKGLRADNKELKQEVAELRKENRAAQYAIANNTDKTQRLLNKWDNDGQPEERVA